MPFLYEVTIASGEPPRTFVQQLIAAGSLVNAGQAVCTLTDGAMEWHVPAPRQGLLVAWLSTHGDEVEPGDALARIVCEGEEADVPAVVATRLG